MTVREMHSRDLPALETLDAELFGADAWPVATWWAELAERPRREYVVVEDEGGILAYGGLDHGGETADVMTIAVAPTARGRGLGRTVLAELERRASAGGASGALLEVRADNAAALALYEKSGWRQVHVRRRYYQPGDVDALIMAKTLAAEEHSS
ncbi:MAG: ribosomal protein S18-alanine N-acetyltransferase [Actinobacteria bacterium]|nr:ribosomal protein S18-alanine N-acetyltransferase [Actinomycetota bacterium]